MMIRRMPLLAALLSLLALGATRADAKVRVITATDNLAWVTQQIGGNLHLVRQVCGEVTAGDGDQAVLLTQVEVEGTHVLLLPLRQPAGSGVQP